MSERNMINFVLNGNDTIPVFKTFIRDYLPIAGANDIKVYLYGQYLASEKISITSEELSDTLGITVEETEKSINSLIRMGFLLKKGDSYSFVAQLQEQGDFSVYTEGSYLDMLSEKMGGRDFSSEETNKLVEFKTVFKLPENVVGMMVEYFSSPSVKGKRVSIEYLKRVAETWADENIRTVDKAQRKIKLHQAASSGALRVINALYGGNRRLPNDQELVLYEKWTQEYGFTLDAVMQAVEEASLVRDPSMKYLDAILEDYHSRGVSSTSDIVVEKEVKIKRREELKEVLETLKSPRKDISVTLRALYEDWIQMGFTHVSILCACDYTLNSGYHSYKKVDELLKHCYSRGIVSNKEIAETLKFKSHDDMVIHQIMEVAGLSGNITEQDRKIFYTATKDYGMSKDMIMLAADQSSMKQDPRSYMLTILNGWKEAGITTLNDAVKQRRPLKKNTDYTGVPRFVKNPFEDDGDAIYR